MTILGIETSCDETAAAIIEGKKKHVNLKATVLATSLALHAKTGGIIPEQAAREQAKFILPVITETLKKAYGSPNNFEQIDAIAITYGPGLIGSLLVGVETAKTLAFVLNKPIIPINHMIGHIYANWITDKKPSEIPAFPALALVVSGGHTDLLLIKAHGNIRLLGGTRDDAAGEAFDKIGRMLDLTYPAGPEIERLARLGNPKRFRFPRPLLYENTYEFSFSGLKAAVLRQVNSLPDPKSFAPEIKEDIARATQDAIIEVLVKKTLRAAKEYQVKSILLSGGVAANQTLRDAFHTTTASEGIKAKIFAPQKSLCTDNAAMIASAAYFNYNPVPWKDITADPELYF
jgi:N6-L-threonylcarbamoyladenine synthase